MINYDDDLTVKRVAPHDATTPMDLSSSEADQEIAQQLVDAEWREDTPTDIAKYMSKVPISQEKQLKSLKDNVPTDKLGKSKGSGATVYTLSILLRKDPESFFNFFANQGNHKNYKLPQEKLEKLLEELAEAILIDQQLLENDERMPSPSVIIQAVIKNLMEGGKSPDPAQVNKALEYLAGLTEEVKPEHEKTRHAKNLNQLNRNIKKAKESFYKSNQQAIENGDMLIEAASYLVDAKVGNRNTSQVLSDLKELIDSPQEVMQVFQHYKKLGFTYAMMEKEFYVMFRDLGIRLKHVRK